MNIKNLLLAFSIVSVVIVSCKSTPENPEVQNYVYKVSPSLAKEELPIIKKFDSIPVQQLIKNPKIDSIIQHDIIDSYSKFIQNLDTVSIKDPELKQIHAKYIEYAKLRLDYYTSFLSYLKKGSMNNIDSLNPKADKLQPLHDDYIKLMSNLVEKYDLEVLEK